MLETVIMDTIVDELAKREIYFERRSHNFLKYEIFLHDVANMTKWCNVLMPTRASLIISTSYRSAATADSPIRVATETIEYMVADPDFDPMHIVAIIANWVTIGSSLNDDKRLEVL